MKRLSMLFLILCLLLMSFHALAEMPIVETPIALTFFTELSDRAASSLKNYNEMIAYQKLEELSNIHLEFEHPAVGQTKEQFNLMLASGELCDIIEYGWQTNYPGGPERALQDGVILDLTDLIDQYAPNLKAVLEEYPDAKKEIITDDGRFYMFPLLRVTKADRMSGGFQIRQDWLDKLGLSMPTTVNEWHNVLVAFRDGDPNGNGLKDEIPFSDVSTAKYFTYWTSAWGTFNGYYMVDGKVKYGPYEPEFKEFLKTMHDWYAEGLIDPDFMATDRKTFDAKVTSGQVGSYYGLLNSYMGTYTTVMEDIDQSFNIRQAPLPYAPDGKRYNFELTAARLAPGNGMAISTQNKYPIETVKLLDFYYSEEGRLLMNMGIEGVTYTMVDGYPKYTDLVLNNPNGLSKDRAICAYAPAGSSGRLFQDPRYWEQMMAYENQKEAMSILETGSSERVLPAVTPTPEQSERLAAIQSEVDTYVTEMLARYIMGQESFDNYDDYVSTLKSLNVEEAIAIQQDALERYNNRGN